MVRGDTGCLVPHCFAHRVHVGDFECSNHGRCVSGYCNCTPGYGGMYCEQGMHSAIRAITAFAQCLVCGVGCVAVYAQRDTKAALPPLSPPHLPHTELVHCGNGYCHNGGQCSAEGTCVCQHAFVGQFCEQEVCKSCNAQPLMCVSLPSSAGSERLFGLQ